MERKTDSNDNTTAGTSAASRSIAIMQPYLFPYIGYFQMIDCVDRFVIYDDVAFIKQGWIARNKILLNGNPHVFSVTLQDPSSFKKINEIPLHEKLYDSWRSKFYKTIEQSYKRAPYFLQVFELMKSVFENENRFIADLSRNSIVAVCRYLNIQTDILGSSVSYENGLLKGKERVIDICKKEKASIYVNLPGGVELYDKVDFESEGLELKFIQPENFEYKQFSNEFVPWLSIIDVLMFNSVDDCKKLLRAYRLS